MFETSYLLYQTLENRGNYEQNEKDGPYSCSWDNSWLGEGFYYWYHHINLAHWWGKQARFNKNGYTIFKSVCNDLSKCWDLHTGPGQDIFFYWLDKMKDKNLLEDKTSVAQVLEFIKNEYPEFPYEGIRILGMDSLSKSAIKNMGFVKMNFEFADENENANKQRFKAFFDPMPPVQVCLFIKDGMGRTGYELVYPEKLKLENRNQNFYI